MTAFGYDNVDVRVGDGTKGLVDEAPFGAILVAAGGPEVPPALKEQLRVGGHLVIPVGDPGGYVWFDETQAVTPLGPEHHRGLPETYPFGV